MQYFTCSIKNAPELISRSPFSGVYWIVPLLFSLFQEKSELTDLDLLSIPQSGGKTMSKRLALLFRVLFFEVKAMFDVSPFCSHKSFVRCVPWREPLTFQPRFWRKITNVSML